jgi:hypothetical protein
MYNNTFKMEIETKPKTLKVIYKQPYNNNNNNNNNILSSNENIERILEKILHISSDLTTKMNELNIKLDEKFDILDKRILKIENIIDTSKDTSKIEDLKEIKKEDLNIAKENVIKVLSYRDYNSILSIFRLYYKNNENNKLKYPINIISTKKFEYYYNNKWNADLYGYHIINTLCTNIQNLFIKYNKLTEIEYDDFISNQQFIYKLSDEKYKKELFKHIIEEVKLYI